MRSIFIFLMTLSFPLLSQAVIANEQAPKTLNESRALNSSTSTGTKNDGSNDFTSNNRKTGPLNTDFETSPTDAPAPEIALTLLGQNIKHGSFERLYWTAGQAIAGLAMPTPILVAAGNKAGPTLCLTAAVHGDELNGVETIRRVMFSLESDKLNGVVIGVPIVNMHGFRRTSRYLPDRRDLNRYFPGDAKSSSAGRIAHSFFNEVITHCDRLIDIHTGSFHRTNITQLRADLGKESVMQFSKMFHDVTVLDGAGGLGTLRRAAVDAGIPAVTLEAGEPLRLQLKEVVQSVNGIKAVMYHMDMIGEKPNRAPKQKVFYKSTWLRADQSGVFLTEAKLGQNVKKGDILGTVTDPITNRSSVIRTNVDGQIIGLALNQMVMPGFAAYHIGIAADEKKVAADKVADSVVAEALEPVAESMKEVAREAAQTAAKTSDDPAEVSAAARKAVQDAARNASQLVDQPKTDKPSSPDAETQQNENHTPPKSISAPRPNDELEEHPE
ncbi:N-alpha-acetyl-L-2,4-diaminobutyric acid deacetylase [Zhongshania aliphaticivorans]|uniref:N-alpha-acetyl-L-2,4-diaminobutyric acid deacetylase n=1 Tax=Zhongshania aliphaticivorans TaxID=1470434 RepID=A0A5S9NNZ5_9GAMM|nr:succinylglutamate desuccinylase/aspartoacylase family protein [Zhongshania aliphaticivorans]CAA0092069.1 N-alpha-acetyl-L-2,4-diaminobutyric acid deacetylase [Zhongshania aliphaticivorans]CAA0099403.1 N-alpha-acetyl-L-2,4-diaminobutyric acid deacetylase [Zhongshania aliphaticivorans]